MRYASEQLHTGAANFDRFTRSAFGLEPGEDVGRQLKSIAQAVAVPRGKFAPLDRELDQVAYLAGGATKLWARASKGREQIVAFHFGGDIVSIPADGVHSYAVTALVDTEMLLFPAREFFDRAAENSVVARALFDRLPAALHRCRDKAVALGRKSALERIAGFLVAMSKRVGRPEGNRCVLELPMSRRDIGDSLGLTIETVSRQLGVLREEGLIETQGRSCIVLFDLDALTRRAGHLCPSEDFHAPTSKIDLDQCDARARRLAPDSTEGN